MIRLFDIALHSMLWTALAIGGANVTIADMERYAVHDKGWLSSSQLISYISLAQAAPGPNGMTVVLIGLHTAGFAGAIVSLFASVGPTSIFAYYAGGWMEVRKTSIWVKAVSKGLAPITVGLFAAASLILVKEVDVNLARCTVTLVSFGVAYLSKVNPIWIVLAGIVGGVFGLLG